MAQRQPVGRPPEHGRDSRHEGGGAVACSAWVSYQQPRKGKPYYIASCHCGCSSWPRPSSRRAFDDARAHTPKVMPAIWALEPGRPPRRR